VPSYRLTEAAAADVESIARHSVQHWGFERAEAYVLALHRTFDMLAGLPDAGRDVGGLRAGYLRFEHERHSIFYQKTGTGILVVRVLHQRLRPGKHL
jgi:toxin ParE1/3/4